ncbi:DUF6879 family protein [Streptomyces sp. NPDC054794]
MRDGYMRSDPRFVAWQSGVREDPADSDPGRRPWLRLVAELTGRGVEVRRARIVSEPVSDYIRFEHHLTVPNVAAGEQVRWLPRRRASRLALPGNDFWLFDGASIVHTGDHRFAMLVEEWVLRTVIGDSDTMAAALGHLISVASLPSVSMGVIPLGTPRGGGWPVESFTIYDDAQVNVELVSAHLTVTQPGEITEYVKAFSELSAIAVYGARARTLITAAIDALP